MNSGTTRILTNEETAELNAIRKATPEQLLVLADKCNTQATIENGAVYTEVICNPLKFEWDPLTHLDQNQLLLAAVISQGDCRLLYDDGIHEYFIYKYRYQGASGDGPPLANNTCLSKTVFSAAMELWFPENV